MITAAVLLTCLSTMSVQQCVTTARAFATMERCEQAAQASNRAMAVKEYAGVARCFPVEK